MTDERFELRFGSDGNRELVDATNGGAQPLSVVGPFTFGFADVTDGNPMAGFVLTTFAAGTIVLDAWIVLTESWDCINALCKLALVGANDYRDIYQSAPSLIETIYSPDIPIDGASGGDAYDAFENLAFNSGDGLVLPGRIRAGGAALAAYLTVLNGVPTAGSCDVYAKIWTPT